MELEKLRERFDDKNITKGDLMSLWQSRDEAFDQILTFNSALEDALPNICELAILYLKV